MMPGLRQRRARHHDPAQLNLTPLIDVLFNLLIFVLASASIAAVGEMPASVSNAGPEEDAPEPVVISIAADLTFAVSGTGATFEAIEDLVASALAAGRTTSVVVSADRTVPTGLLVDVFDAASRGGAEKIAIASEGSR